MAKTDVDPADLQYFNFHLFGFLQHFHIEQITNKIHVINKNEYNVSGNVNNIFVLISIT